MSLIKVDRPGHLRAAIRAESYTDSGYSLTKIREKKMRLRTATILAGALVLGITAYE